MSQRQIEILLVEDNPNDVELTLHSLRKGPLENPIHILRDGAEALEYILCRGRYASRDIADVPRVILLDIKLPLVSGLEVLRQIKADERTHDIPVVVLTSSSEDRDVEEAYKLGASSYIVKPVDFKQFSSAVVQLGMYWLLLNKPPLVPVSTA